MQKNTTPSDILWAAACALVALLIVNSVHAIDTNEIQLGEGATYDGIVRIERDASGRMTFTDASLTTPVTLSDLNFTTSNHADLNGLSNDDHTIYLNETRHQNAHATDFNTSLTLPADANGNTTLGDHVTDNNIHLPADQTVEISAPWRFTDTPQIWSNLHLSNNGAGGDSSINFEDGTDDAVFLWDDSKGAFSINRGLSLTNGDIDLQGALFGNVAKIETDTEYLHLAMDDNETNNIIHDRRGRFDARLNDPTGTPETQAHSLTGKIGKAIEFDGVDDSISIKESIDASIDEGENFTFAFWWKLPNTLPAPANAAYILEHRKSTSPNYIINIKQGDTGTYKYVGFSINGPDGAYHTSSATTANGLQLAAWNHMAVRMNGNTASFFLNGTSISTSSQTGFNTNRMPASFTLGCRYNNTQNAEGALDDFRLYNHALSDAQINAIYNSGNGTANPSTWVEQTDGVANLDKLAIDGGFTNASAIVQVSEGAYCDGTSWITGSTQEMKTNIQPASTNSEWNLLDQIQPVEFQYKKRNPNQGHWIDPQGNRVVPETLTWKILNDPNETNQRLQLVDQGYRVSNEKWSDEPDGPKRIGFIAEDLAQVDPRFNRGPGVAAIDIAAYNTAVLKAMKARITELENRIATLEKAINP